jgi:hypothetical protein
MDIERILSTRGNRATRTGKPFHVFHGAWSQCLNAGRSLLDSPTQPHATLLERSAIITTVTAIEVYYKDVLDGIFRICDPTFFEPHLKRIHATKYDITDLIAFHRNRVHPLELIAASQSFQNTDAIDSVFSKFLGRGLWTSVLDLQVRVKDQPDTECKFDHSNLEDMKALFSLRHELVHDPARRPVFDKRCHNTMVAAAFMVFGSDIVLMEMIAEHQDPNLQADA